MSMPEDDAQLLLKKRARRRLVGAVALAVFAAVVLPMVMDQTPQAPVEDVQIRIPGQDQVAPLKPVVPAVKPAEASATGEKLPPAAEKPVEKSSAVVKPVEKTDKADKPADRPVERTVEKQSDKPAPKVPEKTAEKPAEKAVEKVADKAATKDKDEGQRAAAILAGKPAEAAKPSAAGGNGGEHVILIGAFANPANVKQLQTKLGELNIKVFTETLDSPQGKKTRVRAGPFPNRDAADKALERMKRIGVNGVVAAKQ